MKGLFHMNITEVNRETDFNILSDEDIRAAIDDYFEHKEKYIGKMYITEAIRKLLFVARIRKLYTKTEIMAMGHRVW